MKNKNLFSTSIIKMALLTIVLVFAACSSSDDGPKINEEPKQEIPDEEEPEGQDNSENTEPNALEFILTEDNFSVLAAAIEALDDDVKDLLQEDDITVLAPSDEAFNELFELLEGYSTISDFDEDEELALLQEILQFHIVQSNAILADEFAEGQEIVTSVAENLEVLIDGGIFFQADNDLLAQLIEIEGKVSNGVVHQIDEVLLPHTVFDAFFPKPTLSEIIVENDDLHMFEDALTKGGLFNKLEGDAMTVFAPNNEAVGLLFDLLGEDYDDFDDFQNFLELQVLNDILLGHLVEEEITSDNFEPQIIETLLTNDSIELVLENEEIVIRDASEIRAKFVLKDVEASNGVIHIIDKILIPQKALQFVE
ncbi:fasciclin domain-containing protein [Euzebyella saccharophila]|uniref:Fasciclin domain-containing protein n=1 Tax=Euzebyella saccharophila TaxID=679664 RepID=A0ABV8JWH6_9FLAO|nr:fasciclin domain-containing protein [Euzebyella saccharophila]